MVNVGPYPVETSFFPEHLIIPLASLLIFVLMLYVIARIKRKQITDPTIMAKPFIVEQTSKMETLKKKGTQQQLKDAFEARRIVPEVFQASDTISLVSVIVTIVVALVGPFSQLPVLDYTVEGPFPTDSQGNEKFEISVHNYGSITAKNVILSFKADQGKFEGFSSLPYLAKHLAYNTTSQGDTLGKALVEIEELPPRSYTVISATLSPLSESTQRSELITYLRSSETVAYYQISKLMAFYGTLAFFYVFFGLGFATGLIYPLKENGDEKKINYGRIAIIAIVILSAIIAANLLFFLPYLNVDGILYITYYWVGLLVIPVTVLIICIIYYFSKKPRIPGYLNSAVVTGLILSLIVATGLAIYLPQIKANRTLYMVAVLSTLLVIPIAITIVFIIYRRYSKAVLLASGTVAAGILMLYALGLPR